MYRKLIRISVPFCCYFLFCPGQAYTQDLGPSIAEPRPEIRVNYLGMSESFLHFEVVLRQPDTYFSRLRIRNESGQEIYSERIGRRSAVLKVKVDKEEEGKLTFLYTTSREEVRKQLEVKVKLLEATVVQTFPTRD
ncbi:MAG: hypothetical protein ACKO6K_04660 [Chitinophagaceae bacterium]